MRLRPVDVCGNWSPYGFTGLAVATFQPLEVVSSGRLGLAVGRANDPAQLGLHYGYRIKVRRMFMGGRRISFAIAQNRLEIEPADVYLRTSSCGSLMARIDWRDRYMTDGVEPLRQLWTRVPAS